MTKGLDKWNLLLLHLDHNEDDVKCWACQYGKAIYQSKN